jgi:hypothetical protein
MSFSEWNSDESSGTDRSEREILCAADCLRGGPNGQCRGDVAQASSSETARGTEVRSEGEKLLGNWANCCGPSANASRASGGDASGHQDEDSSGDETDEKSRPLLGRCSSCRSLGNMGQGCSTCARSGGVYSEKLLPGDPLPFRENCPTCSNPDGFGGDCWGCEEHRRRIGYPFKSEKWKCHF